MPGGVDMAGAAATAGVDGMPDVRLMADGMAAGPGAHLAAGIMAAAAHPMPVDGLQADGRMVAGITVADIVAVAAESTVTRPQNAKFDHGRPQSRP